MKFDAKKETKKIIKFIRSYFNENKLDGVVIGISGGKDSTIASALFTKALGKDNVIGINLPCNSIKTDEEDAKRVADFIGFQLYKFDLGNAFKGFETINDCFNIKTNESTDAVINLKPRLRMATLYYVASAISSKKKKRYVVAGTGNKCEIYVGYFTKFGDGASDINILGDLTVSEVLAIGDYLKLPYDLVYKTPSDGLSGKSDEEKLGVTYNQIEKVIKGEMGDEKIEKLHQGTLHKLNPIPIYKKVDLNKTTKKIISNLIKRKETIATMESCTGGFLASTITNNPNASKVFKYGANTYSNEAKIKLGVNVDIIDKWTVYSLPVAREMALNIVKYADADYGVGITGILANKKFGRSRVYVSIYVRKYDQYHDEIIKFRESSKYLGKEKIIEKVITKLGGIINEN